MNRPQDIMHSTIFCCTKCVLSMYVLRCHEIGVRVHYDLHQLAALPDTPSKWELLQTEIKTVMNHPAVTA